MDTSAILGILHREVVPAFGCTEPVAVALAAARAAETLGTVPEKLIVEVSPNILKNGMGVIVPGTGRTGLPVAASAGALGGKSDLGLECLCDLDDETVSKAEEMLSGKKVELRLADNDILLYCKVTAFGNGHDSACEVRDSHSNISRVWKDGKLVYEKKPENSARKGGKTKQSPLTIRSIYKFAREVPEKDIAFILDAAKMNLRVAEEGLEKKYGLAVGKNMLDQVRQKILSDDVPVYAVLLTAAAADARMAGAKLPVMSNSGSGNQGLVCTLPVIAFARRLGKNDEELARALVLSSLVSIHVKHFLGKLSAFCGVTVAAMAAACGIVMLLGGDEKNMEMTIRNMVGNVVGMICDGAKGSCALKVASAVNAGVQSALLAMNGTAVPGSEGIVSDDIETCIANLGRLASCGMKETDKVILEMMLSGQ